MTWTKDFMTSLDVFNVSSGLNLTNQHLANITRQVQTDLVKMNLLPNVTLPEMQKVIDHFDVFNVTKLDIFSMTALDIFNVSKLDIFNMTKLDIFNVTNFDLFNATKQTLMDNPILDQLKTLAPILICSMKIFIQIMSQGGKGMDEAVENRNYLAKRMTDEIDEITR